MISITCDRSLVVCVILPMRLPAGLTTGMPTRMPSLLPLLISMIRSRLFGLWPITEATTRW
jgi:hypothetical protein